MAVKPLKMLSSMATSALLSELASKFSDGNNRSVELESAGGVEVARRVRGGEVADLVVLAAPAIDQLLSDGCLLAGSRVDFARSGMGVAVRSGQMRPDIGTPDALRRAVLAAASLGYSTGPSGQYLVALFERWGIWQELASRAVQAPPGVPVAALVARGDVELGFQQLSEMLAVDGVEVLGPLPAEVQHLTLFSAAASVTCSRPEAARELLDFLASPSLGTIKRQHGMEAA